MRAAKQYFKYAVIALAVICLIAAALLLLKGWESRQGRFPEANTIDGIVSYQGNEYVRKDNMDTYLVLGLDKYEGAASADSHEGGVQADFLMLLVFDNAAKQFSAIHINRDTMAPVNKLGVGGSKIETVTKQIALAYNYGYDDSQKINCRNTADSVEKLLLGINVEHYMAVTMDAVAVINDLAGGVEVQVLDDFTGIDDTLVKGETISLTGEQALHYVRTRYGLEDSTNSTRMGRQQQYINALYDKIVSHTEADDQFLIKAVDAVDDYMAYDSTDLRMKELVQKTQGYEFLGIRELDGETVVGEEFIEFYPDEDSVWEVVIDLFYKQKDPK